MFSLSSRTQAILLLVGIFAIGLVCGAIAERRFLRDGPFRDGRRGGPGPRGGFNSTRPDNRMIDRLSRDLELSEDQKKGVLEIFQKNRQEIEVMRREIGGKMRSQEEKLFGELKNVLTEEQFAKFEERHRRRGFRGRGGRGSGPW